MKKYLPVSGGPIEWAEHVEELIEARPLIGSKHIWRELFTVEDEEEGVRRQMVGYDYFARKLIHQMAEDGAVCKTPGRPCWVCFVGPGREWVKKWLQKEKAP